MIYAFDVGNTRIKWKCVEENGVIDRGIFVRDELGRVLPQISSEAILYVAEVGGHRFAGALALKYPKNRVVELQSEARLLGVTNSYEEPGRLGVDRLLAAMEAWHQSGHRAVAVFDLGTAATMDVVDAKGFHCGGYIVPGLQMLKNSLLDSTSKVRYEETVSFEGNYGRSTAEAVEVGTRRMLISWLNDEIAQFNQRYPEGRIYITGGDATVVTSVLESSVTYSEDLVLDGIVRVARSS